MDRNYQLFWFSVQVRVVDIWHMHTSCVAAPVSLFNSHTLYITMPINERIYSKDMNCMPIEKFQKYIKTCFKIGYISHFCCDIFFLNINI